ncbi:MAG: hypothetical protein VB081_09785, partial [Christensenella sp.]|uniref:hypothetical protein n=1 Tax=Christensenella sp. TaxID=1935934 RepID=UPI002B1F65C2
NRNWFWGIFFILATVVLIASQLVPFGNMGFWPLLGAILLIAVIVQCIMHRGAWGIFVPLALLYMIFQGPLALPYLEPWILIVAGILLTIGFGILFYKRPRYDDHFSHSHCSHGHHSHGSHHREGTISEDMQNENRPSINVSFSGTTRYLQADALEYAHLSCSFGSLEVYFDKVTVSPNGAEIYVDCKFGSIELYVPRNWKILNSTHTGMGGLNFTGTPHHDEASPNVTLSGNVSMAGIEIHYI